MIRIMNTLNKNKSGAHTPLKRLVYLLTLCGFTTSSLGGTFPTTPLHLQDETKTTTAAGVKPNIMLYIDDSGSMMSNYITVTTTDGNKIKKSKQSRMSIVQRALNDVLLEYKDTVNWGYQNLHGTKRVNLNYYYKNKTDNWYEGVPLAELKEWGLGINSTDYCQYNISGDTNYINDSFNQDNNREHFTDDYQTIRKYVACTGRYNYDTPTTTRYNAITKLMLNSNNLKNRCQKSYIVLLSDGDASSGQSPLKKYSQPLFTNDQKTSGQDVWGGSWNDPAFKVQNIHTYTVGFGSGISDEGQTYLTEGATANSKGAPNYFKADSSAELVNAFKVIFDSIKADNPNLPKKVFSSTSPAISSNYVDGLAAAATLNTGSWSSEILFYNINSQGKLDTTKPMRASFDNRKVLISDGSNVHLYSGELTTDVDSKVSKNNPWYSIPNTSTTSSNPNKLEWRDGLLKWMARADTDKNIQAQKTTSQFQLDYRERPLADAANNITDQRSMGDIIDNSILAVGDVKDKRQEFVVTATNDGMVYVFRSQNSATNPYDLKFNYAPAKMERSSNDGSDYVGKYYKDTTRTGYGQDSENNPHRYLLNGGMVTRSTGAGGKGKQFFLASTMGQAGRGAFAINIGGVNRTTGDAIAANNVDTTGWQNDVKLFETASGASNQLGFTIGSPQVGRVQVDTSSVATTHDTGANIHYGVFVSNGYNYKTNYANTNSPYADTPALYVYEGLGQDVGLTPTSGGYTKGTVLQKISVTGGSGGLATPTLVDVNFDGVIDYAYAGDFGGGLYRFNLLSPNPNNWTATKIFQTADNKPITSAPAVFRNSADKYTVVVGTGSEIYQEDLASKAQQAVYGIFDDLTLSGNAALIQSTNLLAQTLTSESITKTGGGTVTVRKVTNKPLDAALHKGWSVALDNKSGERITVKPSIMGNSVLLTTRVYEQELISNTGDDPCLDQTQRASSSAFSWLMQFNLANGGLITSDKDSVYIDFNLGDASKFKLSGDNQQYMITGQKLNSLTSITLIDSLMAGFSASTSGDAGGSGEDSILNPNAKAPKNTCVGDDSKAFTFNTGGESETYNINGACRKPDTTAVYQRLSWREIF